MTKTKLDHNSKIKQSIHFTKMHHTFKNVQKSMNRKTKAEETNSINTVPQIRIQTLDITFIPSPV
jgi:hypothetical protein